MRCLPRALSLVALISAGVAHAQVGTDVETRKHHRVGPAPEEAGEIATPVTGAPKAVLIAISADPFSTRAALHVQHIADERLRRTPTLTPIDPQAALLQRTKPAGADEIASARELLVKAQSAYENLDFDAAIRAYERAIASFEAGAPALASIDELAGAYARLGATRYFAGDPGAAQEDFRHAILLSPKHQPDPAIFPPDLLKLFESQREAIASAPRGLLTVTSSRPPHVMVFVDGRYRGITPLTLEDLPIGPHLIVARRRGYYPSGDPHGLAAADPSTVETSLRAGPNVSVYEENAKAALRAEDARELPEAVSKLATRFGVDRVILAGVETDEDRIHVRLSSWDVHAGARNHAAEITVQPWHEEGRRALVAFFDAELPKTALPAAPPRSVDLWEHLPPYARTWWFWTATGATLAAIGAGIAIAATPSELPPRKHDGLLLLGLP